MEQKEKIWYLEQFDILQKLKKDDIVSMEKSMIMRKINKDTLLHFPEMQNRYIYFLKEGVVKIASASESGQELIKYLVKPGYIFGELPLLENQEQENDYAVALEDCVVCFMDVDKLKHLMRMNEDLNFRIRKLVGIRIRKIENRLVSMIFKTAAERVYDFLAEYAAEFGAQLPDGYEARLFLKQDEIARLTAVSRQTVATVMNDLRNDGKIAYTGSYIKVFASPRSIRR